MSGDPSTPFVERTARGDRVNKYQASVFSAGVIALIAGGVVIIAAAAFMIIKKRSANKQTAKAKKSR